MLALLLCQLNPSYAKKTDLETLKKSQTAETSLPAKDESKNIFGKFLITMLWVAGSCGVIYLLLILYKRHKDGTSKANEDPPDMELNLSSPQNVDEAIDFVIKKF